MPKINTIPPARDVVASIQAYKQGKSSIQNFPVPIKLSSNESAYGPSAAAIAAYHSMADNLCRYPDGSQDQLKQAIANTMNLDYDKLVCGNGSEEIIGLTVRAYLDRQDELLLTENNFVMCPIYGQLQGACVVLAKEKNFQMDVDTILAAVTDKTRLVIIANPNNPTGTYLAKTEIERLHTALPADVLLMLDEAYAEYATAEDYSSGLDLVEQFDNVMVTRTFSKIHALPALRIGWACCPPAVAQNLNKTRTPFNANSAAMAAATAAIKDTAWLAKIKHANASECQRVSAALTQIGLDVIPSQTNFYLLSFDAIDNKTAVDAGHYLEENGIIPRPVGAGGGHDILRITLGLEAENTRVIEVMTKYMAQ